MKLTAKLLKKIIREAVKGGVPGIAKYYADEDSKIPLEYAKLGAELSGGEGMDSPFEQSADDVQESVFIELKEIIADFVDQYYTDFLSDVLEIEGGNNYPDGFDAMKITRARIESFIDKTYYTKPQVLQGYIFAVISSKMLRNRSLKPFVKYVRNKMRENPRFYSSYDELYDALANKRGEAPELEKLNIKKEINDAIQEFSQAARAANKLKIQPIENYQNYIRLVPIPEKLTKQQKEQGVTRNEVGKQKIVTIFETFLAHLRELLQFIGKYDRMFFDYSRVRSPDRFTIDPEIVVQQHEFYRTKSPRKQIETEDSNGKKKSIAQIVNEVERYIEDRVGGEFISRYGDPMVQQKMMPEKFPMTEAKLKRMIFEELIKLANKR